MVAVPGFILAGLMWFVLRDPTHIATSNASANRSADAPSFGSVFRHGNV